MADLEPVMIKPGTMTDIEFLRLPQLTQRNHLYLYRTNSALLRPAVRAKVEEQAKLDGRDIKDVTTCSVEVPDTSPLADGTGNESNEEKTKTIELPSLYATVTEVSLFADTLTTRDLGDKSLRQPTLNDIERALELIASNGTEQSVCLLVPEKHPAIETAAWNTAAEAIGLIEELMVTPENYLAVARAYFSRSRLGDLEHLSDNRRFRARLKQFVEKRECTPFALSIEIDLIVLGEMEGGVFRENDETEQTKRRDRWVLPETLRRFLDNRDTPSLSALMLVVDRLRHDRMLEPHEILTRLYRATAGTLESRDKRYRRPEDPVHCVWAALLLANENNFLNGNTFISMDDQCQKYGRAARAPAWFGSSDGWLAIAQLVEIDPPDKPNRLDNARLELQRALRVRLKAMESAELAWFHSLVRSSESEAALNPANEQVPPLTAGVGW
jgi:hypothetical protein